VSEPGDTLDLDTIDKMMEVAENLGPPILPSRWRNGKEYYWLAGGAQQAQDVIQGRVPALQPARIEADRREDGSWAVVVLDVEGAPLLFCAPGFYCRVAGISMAELAEKVGVELVKT
jgi:hypothetical protein